MPIPAGGLVQRLDAEDPLATEVASVTLNVNYLRQATGDLRGTAEIIRSGSTVGVSDVEVTTTSPAGDEKLVATGQPSHRLFR
ncbi:MAG: PaaI family thioesterase [Halolamina sp.]|uniref:PaaI family thioesterase n=1 Tax=Halolamina sp. TaxID=1940283 RepID=UPI002FC35D94